MIDLNEIRAVEDEFIADGLAPSVVVVRIARVVKAARLQDAEKIQKTQSEQRVLERARPYVEDMKRGVM